MKSRPITDRLQDRLWTLLAEHQALALPLAPVKAAMGGSISGNMAWPQACAAYADGVITSVRFRRLRAVMEVVETLAPCDGRFHARLIRASGHAAYLKCSDVLALASWGDPFVWPSALLGTSRAMAPTTLRYLSHALWLRDHGLVGEGLHVAEIGVGYGGLVAINALISKAHTTLFDLPNVERAARKMLAENGLAHAVKDADAAFDCVISNYAFTELSTDLQDRMLSEVIAVSRHGMILSNANVFYHHIGGRSNEQILAALATHGIKASSHCEHPLLSPADRACGCVLILW
jgi:hypothetical protein